jgi:ABC-type transport system involved in Fe-S cluster assembly fused permease/ATPase subunit
LTEFDIGRLTLSSGKRLSGRTSLVIAHRLSTVREASQIPVIDAGQDGAAAAP